MKLNGLKWAGAIVAIVSTAPLASAIIISNPKSVTITISSDLTATAIADPVLVYQYSDGTNEHLGAVLLGSPIPLGATGPFPETINTPAGFVSGTATIFGLYPNAGNPGGCPVPCGIGMVFNTTAGSTAEPGENYATAFPSGSGYPAETGVGSAILLQDSNGNTALENFFAISTTDWVPFTIGLGSTTVDMVLFTASISDGTLTINSVTTGVPEPGTLLLLAGGITAIAVKRRLRP